jgi:hypothetical protein
VRGCPDLRPVVVSLSALLHEKSYPLVGFPLFFLRASEVPIIVPRSCPSAFLGSRRGWLFVVGRVRFLLKPAFSGRPSTCVTGRTSSASDLLWRSSCARYTTPSSIASQSTVAPPITDQRRFCTACSATPPSYRLVCIHGSVISRHVVISVAGGECDNGTGDQANQRSQECNNAWDENEGKPCHER